MSQISLKQALIVRGGWDGHQPVEAADMFIPYLEENGFSVAVHDSSAVYADVDAMSQLDLIVQCNTKNTIEREEIAGLRAAVESGVGMAGWHGGIVDSYRNEADYLQMIGGQFAHHPSVHPDEVRGERSDYYIPYRVDVHANAVDHPIMQGISSFELTTEQYWVLSDDYNEVLATTTLASRPWNPWARPITSPAVWTRQWGAGRIFVCTAGHNVDVLKNESVRTIIERGMLWASR